MLEPTIIVGALGAVLALASGLVKKYQERKIQQNITITVRDDYGHAHTMTVPLAEANSAARALVDQTSAESLAEKREIVRPSSASL